MTPRKHSPETEAFIARDYQAGSTFEVLAHRYSTSKGTIRNTLVRQGVAIRPAAKAPAPLTPTKFCSSCRRDLPRSDFSREGRRTSECKSCTNEKQKDRYWSDEVHRQQKIDSAKTWQAQNPERRRAYARTWATGWTEQAFKEAWDRQQGRCAICDVPMLDGSRESNSVCADHDHKTGHARALLCQRCNKHLGIYEQNHERFRAYLVRMGSLP